MRRPVLPALAVLAALSTLAAAAPVTGAEVDCDTTGGRGWGTWIWSGRTALSSVSLKARDTGADSYHPAVRLVTVTASGAVKHWSWHHVYGGSGATETWNTSARDGAGIKRASIEVGIFDGGEQLNYFGCTSLGPANPRF
ncbi:hypothetical protein ABZX85_43740 [Streptomyces sp. NPDC004539]|uniref:hypothetical protein n=1 Tax=Streptomyces sp. NPDC004539 TaxID=3154280 RepID=UPI00339EB7C0